VTDETAPRDELRREVGELRASRARIMARANGDRRDIERGLHDGVQQDLVALAVNLQLAQQLASSDLASLTRLLVEMRKDVGDALEGVGALVRGIYPPLLADLGVAAALRGAASVVGIPVRIEAKPERYPPDIEATVYFCCLEALETLARSGRAGRASLRVWREHESLLFEVVVEGGPGAHDERVLDSVRTGMNDRVGAVDGTLEVFVEPECTRVRGTISLGRDH
jgi:signal transduction histidine kinase